ncbi:hypothetical protein TRFO_19053 [Tritrichomonas foetus]|uniref:Uncharacterized protein n=1 Tax=Tritrichomonas foetus TaxID=1144522 RepID=A0A1J4KNY7_9EUKA|nr:hypothetical protein TRFO_19053 [Tritrichomonas foetus]|eukprot:OHT11508.1 hypothetical protein TRFO_19053 [Tritrichomonas foetus]
MFRISRKNGFLHHSMSISSSIANDKLTELRNKKKLAIQALDFDAAEEYDRQIREQNEQIIADRIAKINSEIIKDLNEHITKYENIRNDINEFNMKQESQLNATYQELIDKTVLQHEKELKNIDKSHSIALLREAEREVPDQIDLLEQAKAAAVAGRYEDARNLRDRARLTGENELEERKQKIDKEFAESRSMLAAKQQDAIEHITQKYDEEISNLNAEVQLRRLETEQRFESGVQLIRQRAEVRCNSLVADDEVKEDAIFELNQRINDLLRDSQQQPGSGQSKPMKSAPQNNDQKVTSADITATPTTEKIGKSKSSARSISSTSSSRSTSTSTSRSTSSRASPRSGAGSGRLGQMSTGMSRKLTGTSAAGSTSSGRKKKL